MSAPASRAALAAWAGCAGCACLAGTLAVLVWASQPRPDPEPCAPAIEAVYDLPMLTPAQARFAAARGYAVIGAENRIVIFDGRQL